MRAISYTRSHVHSPSYRTTMYHVSLLVRVCIAFGLLGLSLSRLQAQKEGYVWCFGDSAGLDFNSLPGAPTAIATSVSTMEGVASIADDTGNLLFYTDGRWVWDANHQVMPNGAGLLGDSSSTQSGVIVPHPGFPGRYFIFTVDAITLTGSGPGGFRYSEVDMSLNGGLGDVIPGTKNTLLFNNQSEKITAVRHANNTDLWVIGHSYSGNNFYVYHITPAGISPTPNVQSIGTAYNTYPLGYIKASPDGSRLACALGGNELFEVYDFDNATGTISNPITLNGTNQDLAYGVEFSPSGQFLYATSVAFGGFLYQFDLNQPTPAAIMASRVLLHQFVPGTSQQRGGAVQLGPDQRIYVANVLSNFLHRIDNPDQPGFASTLTLNAVDLSPHASRFGLPNFIASFFADAYAFTNAPVCLGDTIQLNAVDITSSVPPATFSWTGPNGFSATTRDTFITNASAQDSGLYVLQVIATVSGITDTLYDTIHVGLHPPAPTVTLLDDTSLCPGDLLVLTTLDSADGSYLWQDGSTADTFLVSNSGVYELTVSTLCGADSDSVAITYLAPPMPFDLGADRRVCRTEVLTLDASQPRVAYLWQDASTDSVFEAVGPGTYFCTVSTACGQVSDTIRLRPYPAPVPFDLGPDTTLCTGEQWWLRAQQSQVRYLWQDSSTHDSLLVTQPGTYWLTLTDSCGEATQRDSVVVQFVAPLAPVNLGPDTTICAGATLVLDATATQPGAQYQWQDSSQAATLLVRATGTYAVTVSNQCGRVSDTATIETLSPPQPFELGPDTTVCTNDSLWLRAPQADMSYLWSDGSGQDRLLANTAGLYWLAVFNRCGAQRDSLRLDTLSPPAPIDLGPDTVLCRGEVLTISLPAQRSETFLWQDGTAGQPYSINQAGTFSVVATNACGQASDDLVARMRPTPQPFDLGRERGLCAGDSIWLGLSPDPLITYQWQDGLPLAQRWVRDTGRYHLVADNRCGRAEDEVRVVQRPAPTVILPADTQLCIGQVLNLDIGHPSLDTYRWSTGREGPSLQIRATGQYFAIGTNACGADTASLAVTVEACDCQVFVASAFTPDQDMVNDLFAPVYACEAEIVEFSVFNRWGQQVWSSASGEAWDGNFRGRPVPQGVYVWTLRYRWLANQTTRERQLAGSVTVIR